MRPAQRPSRRGRRGGPVAEAAPPVAAARVSWDELSPAEQTALKRMNRGHYSALPEAMGKRLLDLGLAASRADGIGISRLGRELVINTLIETRKRD